MSDPHTWGELQDLAHEHDEEIVCPECESTAVGPSPRTGKLACFNPECFYTEE